MLKVIAFVACVSVVHTAPAELSLNFNTINEFALKLLRNVHAFQENFGRSNIAVSPLSVWSLFSLLAEGSTGETFQELMNELKLPKDLKATQKLHQAVDSILNSNSQDITLSGKKAMFSDCTLQIHPEFCQAAVKYNTDVYSVNPTNTTTLASDINYFICIATEGRIRNVVSPETLENFKLILVDALYFKANWTHPFDPTQTKQDKFYNTQGKTIGSVNMMFHKAPHNIADVPQIGAQVLEMTYGKNMKFSMLILLPYDGMPFKNLLENLATQPLNWMMEFNFAGRIPDIDVYVPRFKISSQLDLIPPLQYSAIHSIFDKDRAQLPGVSDTPLFVSKTMQNVEIEVTEEGTVAASSTVVGLENRILGQRFEANKEFVFLITERQTKAILFAGVYSDPSIV